MAKGTNKTVGQLINENAQKEPEILDMREVCEAAQACFAQGVKDTVAKGLNTLNHDFFIVCEGKVERLLQGTIRNFITMALFCPTPHFGQTVYHVDHKREKITLLWTIPDKGYAQDLRYALQVSEEEKPLRDHVIDFYEGRLALKADKYNNQRNPMEKIEEIYG